MIRLIILTCLFFTLASSLTAPQNPELIQDNESSSCFHHDGYYHCDTENCKCEYLPSDVQIIRLLSLISPCFSFTLILGYMMIKEFRQQPGDFFLGFAIGEIGLAITSLVESIYDSNHNDGLDASDDFCFWIAAFRVLFRRTIRIYHACYIIYYIDRKRPASRERVKSSLKSSSIPRVAYHVIPWLAGVVLLVLQIAQNSLGKTLQGTCDVMSSPQNDRFRMELVICLICFVASLILITRLSSFSANLSASAKRHFTYYLSYFICANVFLITTLAAKVYGVFALRNYKNQDNEDNRAEVVFSEEAVILIDTISPVILTLIRIYDPFLTRLWIQLFIKICCFCRRKELAEDPSGLCPWKPEEEEDEESDFEKQRRTTSFMPPNAFGTSNFLSQVRDNYRVQVVYSLLAAIHYDWKKARKIVEEPEVKDDGYYNKKAKEEIQYDISEKIVKEKVPYVLEEIRKRDFPLLSGKLTVYSPEIFQEIRKMDGMDQDLISSLDLGKNFNRILKSGKAQGGRGGEFFFFSNDNRLILKTVNAKELNTLLGILPRFSRHFQINPKSIIAKIYAAFTFEVNEPYEKYHLILMKNINGYPSNCTLRKYDLKGSTVDRRVTKQKEEVPDLKAYGTMKDQDFDKHEGRLYIKEEVQYDLLDTIVRDVAFFRMEGLIDYSLAVYLVNRENVEVERLGSTEDLSLSLHDDNEEIRETLNSANLKSVMMIAHPLLSIKSTKEDVYYHIGIIDYLSHYDWKKRVEKFYKQLKAFNFGLDTSCQDPHTYNRRFLGYMENIILESLAGSQ